MGSTQDLDEIDSSILKLLRENSRRNFQELSELTGISDATIQFRLKRMKARGVIDKFTVIVNPAATGYAVTAIMLIQTETDKHDEAKVALAEIPEITEVYGVLGEQDLYIKVWSRSLEELNSILNDKIRSIDGIEDIQEILGVERVKEEMPPI